MASFYLLRHGENRANLTKEFSYKQVDYPLTPKAVLQAQQTGQFLRNQKAIKAIYTSPLKRALQTAQIIGDILHLTPTVVENFREMNVGKLENLPPVESTWQAYRQVVSSWIEGNPTRTFPHGENYHQLWARYHSSLREIVIAHPQGGVLIVGHGGIFTFTLPDLCPDIEIHTLLRAENHNCALTEIQLSLVRDHLVGKLIQWASSGHLHGKAAELISGTPRRGELAEK